MNSKILIKKINFSFEVEIEKLNQTYKKKQRHLITGGHARINFSYRVVNDTRKQGQTFCQGYNL